MKSWIVAMLSVLVMVGNVHANVKFANWVCVSNEAKLPEAEVRAVVAAVQTQLTRDFMPAWGMEVHLDPSCDYHERGTWRVVLKDSSGEGDSGGFHGYNPVYDEPFAVVDTHADGLPWSVVLSHEILEMVVDPRGNRIVKRPDDMYVMLEICDAVEHHFYEIDHVQVSDFVLPAWFDGTSLGPWDFLKFLTRPFDTYDADRPAVWEPVVPK